MIEASSQPVLSDREKRVFDALRDYIAEHKRPPSMRELSALTGLASTSSVLNQLRNLADKGYIRRGAARTARQIEIVDPDQITPSEAQQLREVRDLIRTWTAPVPLSEVLTEVVADLRRRHQEAHSQTSVWTDPLGGSPSEETPND